ncbi:DUF6933 domain-containing protein [Psychromonas ossibalaenae]|uniref:DUF6933 domain-containing protein n=1 Tax=Psychromonas ossibalaenae TaxID=444922 RepID=UPI000366A97B|nr:hypothetical protein [Psychromonas ossibalaenae]
MLIFNCSKTAADFFTSTRNKVKRTPIEPAPHKTIAESIASPILPEDIPESVEEMAIQHWLVHCITVKRKKVLIVMNYLSRYCLVFYAGKKGDEIEFLNTFELHLKVNFRYLCAEAGISNTFVEQAIAHYNNQTFTCAFHQRSDRSVQAHIKDAAWHIERWIYEGGLVFDKETCLQFDIYMGKTLRKRKADKDYFYPVELFMENWFKELENKPVYKVHTNQPLNNETEPVNTENNIVSLADYRK